MKFQKVIGSAITSIAFATSANATTVLPDGVLTDLGSFSAGTYILNGSGSVDLIVDAPISILPDGMPAGAINNPLFVEFNPDGSYTAEGVSGPAGTNAKIGSLIGTLTSNPISQSDWFLIGYTTPVTLLVDGHIYASVNDTFYPNNSGSFNVTVRAVPLPASAWLMGSAMLGLMGMVKRKA